MGIGGGALVERAGSAAERSDHQLVSAVRRGDDRAFEQLYERYQRRIAAYVGGMVNDHGRAEDITQEVFVSALRRMRATERPIAFKPWLYQIAKNACIDAYRQRRRAEEVSFEADERLSPADRLRLVATAPEPAEVVDVKQDVEHLFGAFGEVADTHYEILVMREFEGLSYHDIGARLGISRPAVESALFRARKRLGEEYGELASGERCARMQSVIAGSGARSGRGERRRLARHVSHCDACRSLAARAGLDLPMPARRGIAEKLAGLLPFPLWGRFRREGEPTATAPPRGNWVSHLPMFADSASSGWTKAAAGIAALLLAGGAGVSTIPGKAGDDPAARRAPAPQVAAGGGANSSATIRNAAAAVTAAGRATSTRSGGGGSASRPSASGGKSAAGGGGEAASGGTQGGATPRLDTPGLPQAPSVSLPGAKQTVDKVTGALPDVGKTVTPLLPKSSVNLPDASVNVPAPTVNVPDPTVTVPEPSPTVPDVPAVPDAPDLSDPGSPLP